MLDSLKAKRLVPVFGAVAMALAVFFSIEARYGANALPTAIFVVLDTMRADRTSLCGYAHSTTPKLEELVDRGASYACSSHAPSTWTLPSHATFFTGLGPEDHQAGSGGNTKGMTWGSVTPLGPRWPTLAEEMTARGYQTLLLSGNPVVGERMGLTRGFDHSVVARSYPEMHDHRLADRLKLILRYLALDPDRPLFAFINIADPHAPWRGIPEDEGFLPARPPMMIDPGRARFESGEMGDEEAEAWLSHMSDVYDYSVLRADRSLARVLEALEADGWLDGEYRLVITSDHGEYLGEHQLVEHGRPFFYEPVTRVPFETEANPRARLCRARPRARRSGSESRSWSRIRPKWCATTCAPIRVRTNRCPPTITLPPRSSWNTAEPSIERMPRAPSPTRS